MVALIHLDLYCVSLDSISKIEIDKSLVASYQENVHVWPSVFSAIQAIVN